jgi:hypothetical protein
MFFIGAVSSSRCGLNLLENIPIVTSDHKESFDAQGQFLLDLDIHASGASICTFQLFLHCCVSHKYFEEQATQKLQQTVVNYREYVDKLLTQPASSALADRPKQWHCNKPREAMYTVGIKSYALNFHLRAAIRRTWLEKHTR